MPSPAALKKIAAPPVPVPSSEADEGEKIVQGLLAMERPEIPSSEIIAAWKVCLEDFDARTSGDTAAVWAAIRAKHGGVLRTSYGVLVASKDLVMKVFQNAGGNYSVAEYQHRMRKSIGEIFLGMDEGAAYRAQSKDTNRAIRSITESDAFIAARDKANVFLEALLDAKKEATFDTRELSDEVLTGLSKDWFDLPDGKNVEQGGWSWIPISGRKPQCPGDFTTPSRYLFSPNPGSAVKDYGQAHGNSLRRAVAKFVTDYRGQEHALRGPLSKAMFAAIPDDDQLARTITGVMMGFLPTVDGSLRSTLFEWMDDKTLWRVQEALVSDLDKDRYAAANRVLRTPLMRTMQHRPVPDLVWRTAVRKHYLGGKK